uniref:Striatin, calmodulin binding protein 4 n=1 Tax=Neogobius melanostomus TaxID=47308 RepID=A0A8C6U670_9GOBI
MEADRSGGGPNPNSGGGVGSSLAGRNPNGPKAAPGQATAHTATGAMAAAAAAAATVGPLPVSMPGSQPRELLQEGDSGMTLPGILHFIQYEWGRFQAEKYRWEAERDELRAQVAFLQGERKGQENMKQDLVRRIKMLEYALKQERQVYFDSLESEPANQMSWKEGRQLLRKYLEEVGYSDTILDMRSKRVRSLLGRSSPEANGPPPNETSEAELRTAGESLLTTKEHLGGSVLDKIPFLHGCEDDDEDDSDEEDDFQGITTDCIDGPRKNKKSRMGSEPMTTDLDPEDEEDEDDSEDAQNEFDFLGSGEDGEGAGEARISGDGRELVLTVNTYTNHGQHITILIETIYKQYFSLIIKHDLNPSKISNLCFSLSTPGGALGFSSDVFIMDAVGGGDMNLGELADLTVANDNDLSLDMHDNREEFKKTWNPRFTLRSHFDAIRALTFHPSQAVLLTASEDGTLKLWNLNKAMHSKKNAALDVEPIYTFRAHSGAVLSLTMGEDGDTCYSGGLDGAVRCWKMPDLNVDPYDNYDPSIESSVLSGHEDSVWGLAYSAMHHRLASCSADGTIRIWNPQNSAPCLSVFNKEREHGTPTSVAFVATDPNQIVVSYDGGETLIYDLNTEQSVTALLTETKDGSELINRVVSHPLEALSITAHENRTIRFADNKTGKVVHSMVAHLDAVTCLTTDPKGTYLISGSHDCSVRLWMLDNRTCVQEITAHRKKHDEAIHDVAFHSSQPFIASAGADALAKIFVW